MFTIHFPVKLNPADRSDTHGNLRNCQPCGKEENDSITKLLSPNASDAARFVVNSTSQKIHNADNSRLKTPQKRKSALITGATSGIGKAFAFEFARKGYDLIITGRRQQEIYAVADQLKKDYKIRVTVLTIDLSVHDDLARLIKLVQKKKNIEILVNNAGFGLSEKFYEDQVNNQLKMLKVHVTAPLVLIHRIIPQMIKQGSGTIINVASLAAYTPTPDNAMYTGTKSFLINFTESLHMELHNYGIRVQCLCPGLTHSDFHNKLNKIKLPVSGHRFIWMNPAEVVNYSLNCLEKDKIICIPGASNRAMVGIISIMPRRFYYFLMNRLTHKHQSCEKIPRCTSEHKIRQAV